MAGHSKWKQIKYQKEAADKKRGALFSKLLQAITVAAKTDPNPQFNPRLRAAINKAKENNVPGENIERAIKRASDKSSALEELLLEGYGPGGVAVIITAITDNPNRTIPEIKKILGEHGAKLSEPGSVRWAFIPPTPGGDWQAKFTQKTDTETMEKLKALLEELEDHPDVQNIYHNAA
jgi:YebC/PmpR family DNA-binding regulatory protein